MPLVSDEVICERVSRLPDRILLSSFDKPLQEELGSLTFLEKMALRAWWFNPDQWAELVKTTKVAFIKYLLSTNTSAQHEIATKLRGKIMHLCRTLCGYNAVKGACQMGMQKLTARKANTQGKS